MANEPSRLTDNLLHVYNYCFTETVPYAFFKPNKYRDIPVRLTGKDYHCKACGEVLHVTYQPRPLTYYSKGKLAEQRRLYEEVGQPFPVMGEIEEGKRFTNVAVGYCPKCAETAVLQSEDPGQKVCNVARQLHREDELVVAKAREAMEKSLTDWLNAQQTEDFQKYDFSTFDALRDLICAVMLDYPQGAEDVLADYKKRSHVLAFSCREALKRLPDTWQAYVGYSVNIYESMHDKMYHEYTVAFPAMGTPGTEYFIRRTVEKSRIEMFLDQPRVQTVEDLMTEVGFHGEWIDLISQRVRELQR